MKRELKEVPHWTEKVRPRLDPVKPKFAFLDEHATGIWLVLFLPLWILWIFISALIRAGERFK